MRAAASLQSKANDFVSAMMSETGSTEGWARFNLMLAAASSILSPTLRGMRRTLSVRSSITRR
jgi:hypothetical protein